MPISKEEFEKLPPWTEPRWKRAEEQVRKVLEEKLGKPLRKEKLLVGKPREFDLVSPDKSTVVQVKSSKDFELQDPAQHRVRFAECMLDYVLLEKVKADKKIFVITDKSLHDYFMQESKGLVSPDIEVMLIELMEE